MANAHIEYTPSELTKALAEFQKNLPEIALDAENPHFRSKFASLPGITKIVLPLLAEQGIAFSATPRVTENGHIMEAHLLHISGERLTSSFPITVTDPQKVGSAVTYFRRYALASMTGIVADADDDGNAASIPSAAERQIQKAASRPTSAPKAQGAQAEIRAWINEPAEGWEERRDKANAAVTRLKAEKVKSTEIWGLVAAEVIPGDK